MEKKERLFYLDFIRAVAVCLIVLTHYNAIYVYLWDEVALKKVVFTWRTFNLYIGDFGVSLFLIISGAALMYVYDTKLELKSFYKKRFLSIYPMFWIAYFFAFMYSFWKMKGIDQSIPKMNIIWSILGMDGYLNGVVPTFYKVGEWFLGFIVIFYIIFPILRKGIVCFPKTTGVITFGIYCASEVCYSLPLSKSTFILTRLPEILFGMYFVRYIKLSNRKFALAGLTVLILNTIIRPSLSSNIQTTYVGIAGFLVFSYIGECLKGRRLIENICKSLSRYSYAIFLTHHFIIYEMAQKFDLFKITVLESYLLFILCCFVIAFFTIYLYNINNGIQLFMRKAIKG